MIQQMQANSQINNQDQELTSNPGTQGQSVQSTQVNYTQLTSQPMLEETNYNNTNSYSGNNSLQYSNYGSQDYQFGNYNDNSFKADNDFQWDSNYSMSPQQQTNNWDLYNSQNQLWNQSYTQNSNNSPHGSDLYAQPSPSGSLHPQPSPSGSLHPQPSPSGSLHDAKPIINSSHDMINSPHGSLQSPHQNIHSPNVVLSSISPATFQSLHNAQGSQASNPTTSTQMQQLSSPQYQQEYRPDTNIQGSQNQNTQMQQMSTNQFPQEFKYEQDTNGSFNSSNGPMNSSFNQSQNMFTNSQNGSSNGDFSNFNTPQDFNQSGMTNSQSISGETNFNHSGTQFNSGFSNRSGYQQQGAQFSQTEMKYSEVVGAQSNSGQNSVYNQQQQQQQQYGYQNFQHVQAHQNQQTLQPPMQQISQHMNQNQFQQTPQGHNQPNTQGSNVPNQPNIQTNPEMFTATGRLKKPRKNAKVIDPNAKPKRSYVRKKPLSQRKVPRTPVVSIISSSSVPTQPQQISAQTAKEATTVINSFSQNIQKHLSENIIIEEDVIPDKNRMNRLCQPAEIVKVTDNSLNTTDLSETSFTQVKVTDNSLNTLELSKTSLTQEKLTDNSLNTNTPFKTSPTKPPSALEKLLLADDSDDSNQTFSKPVTARRVSKPSQSPKTSFSGIKSSPKPLEKLLTPEASNHTFTQSANNKVQKSFHKPSMSPLQSPNYTETSPRPSPAGCFPPMYRVPQHTPPSKSPSYCSYPPNVCITSPTHEAKNVANTVQTSSSSSIPNNSILNKNNMLNDLLNTDTPGSQPKPYQQHPAYQRSLSMNSQSFQQPSNTYPDGSQAAHERRGSLGSLQTMVSSVHKDPFYGVNMSPDDNTNLHSQIPSTPISSRTPPSSGSAYHLSSPFDDSFSNAGYSGNQSTNSSFSNWDSQKVPTSPSGRDPVKSPITSSISKPSPELKRMLLNQEMFPTPSYEVGTASDIDHTTHTLVRSMSLPQSNIGQKQPKRKPRKSESDGKKIPKPRKKSTGRDRSNSICSSVQSEPDSRVRANSTASSESDVPVVYRKPERNPAYTFSFHIPTPVFKKMKFRNLKAPVRDDVKVVRMNPRDARKYSLMKVGKEIVRVKNMSAKQIIDAVTRVKHSKPEIVLQSENLVTQNMTEKSENLDNKHLETPNLMDKEEDKNIDNCTKIVTEKESFNTHKDLQSKTICTDTKMDLSESCHVESSSEKNTENGTTNSKEPIETDIEDTTIEQSHTSMNDTKDFDATQDDSSANKQIATDSDMEVDKSTSKNKIQTEICEPIKAKPPVINDDEDDNLDDDINEEPDDSDYNVDEDEDEEEDSVDEFDEKTNVQKPSSDSYKPFKIEDEDSLESVNNQHKLAKSSSSLSTAAAFQRTSFQSVFESLVKKGNFGSQESKDSPNKKENNDRIKIKESKEDKIKRVTSATVSNQLSLPVNCRRRNSKDNESKEYVLPSKYTINNVSIAHKNSNQINSNVTHSNNATNTSPCKCSIKPCSCRLTTDQMSKEERDEQKHKELIALQIKQMREKLLRQNCQTPIGPVGNNYPNGQNGGNTMSKPYQNGKLLNQLQNNSSTSPPSNEKAYKEFTNGRSGGEANHTNNRDSGKGGKQQHLHQEPQHMTDYRRTQLMHSDLKNQHRSNTVLDNVMEHVFDISMEEDTNIPPSRAMSSNRVNHRVTSGSVGSGGMAIQSVHGNTLHSPHIHHKPPAIKSVKSRTYARCLSTNKKRLKTKTNAYRGQLPVLDPESDDQSIVLKDVNLTDATSGVITPVRFHTPVAGRSPGSSGIGLDKIFDTDLMPTKEEIECRLKVLSNDYEQGLQSNKIFANVLGEQQYMDSPISTSLSNVSSRSTSRKDSSESNEDQGDDRYSRLKLKKRKLSSASNEAIKHSKRERKPSFKIRESEIGQTDSDTDGLGHKNQKSEIKRGRGRPRKDSNGINSLPIHYIITNKFKGHYKMMVKLDNLELNQHDIVNAPKFEEQTSKQLKTKLPTSPSFDDEHFDILKYAGADTSDQDMLLSDGWNSYNDSSDRNWKSDSIKGQLKQKKKKNKIQKLEMELLSKNVKRKKPRAQKNSKLLDTLSVLHQATLANLNDTNSNSAPVYSDRTEDSYVKYEDSLFKMAFLSGESNNTTCSPPIAFSPTDFLHDQHSHSRAAELCSRSPSVSVSENSLSPTYLACIMGSPTSDRYTPSPVYPLLNSVSSLCQLTASDIEDAVNSDAPPRMLPMNRTAEKPIGNTQKTYATLEPVPMNANNSRFSSSQSDDLQRHEQKTYVNLEPVRSLTHNSISRSNSMVSDDMPPPSLELSTKPETSRDGPSTASPPFLIRYTPLNSPHPGSIAVVHNDQFSDISDDDNDNGKVKSPNKHFSLQRHLYKSLPEMLNKFMPEKNNESTSVKERVNPASCTKDQDSQQIILNDSSFKTSDDTSAKEQDNKSNSPMETDAGPENCKDKDNYGDEDIAAANGRVSITPNLPPPSRNHVRDTAVPYGLNTAVIENAYFSNPNDLPERTK